MHFYLITVTVQYIICIYALSMSIIIFVVLIRNFYSLKSNRQSNNVLTVLLILDRLLIHFTIELKKYVPGFVL
jgi:hypothetical protein